MTVSPDESLRMWTLPKGSLVKVGGIPYVLTSATVVRGTSDPQQVVAQASDASERQEGAAGASEDV